VPSGIRLIKRLRYIKRFFRGTTWRFTALPVGATVRQPPGYVSVVIGSRSPTCGSGPKSSSAGLRVIRARDRADHSDMTRVGSVPAGSPTYWVR
jgi:hypothetical protein